MQNAQLMHQREVLLVVLIGLVLQVCLAQNADVGRWILGNPSKSCFQACQMQALPCFQKSLTSVAVNESFTYRAPQTAALLYHPFNPSLARSIGWCQRSVLCERRSFDLRGRRTQHLSPLLLRAY